MKLAYNKLSEELKRKIVEYYYRYPDKEFLELSNILNVSERAFSRVLREEGINTRLKNRYTLNDSYFSKIDTEEKAYWLGFIYADGYVGDSHYNNIVINSIDKEHLEKFKKAIAYTGKIRKVNRSGGYKTDKESYTINFSNPNMCKDLRELGLYPGKSTTMESLPNIPDNLVRHFIRGYFDGDGSICASKNRSVVKGKLYEYEKPVFNMIGTKEFLSEMLIKMPIERCNYAETNNRSENMIYMTVCKRSDVVKIYDYFYKDSTIFLERKYDKFTSAAPLCRNV